MQMPPFHYSSIKLIEVPINLLLLMGPTPYYLHGAETNRSNFIDLLRTLECLYVGRGTLSHDLLEGG